MRAHRARTRDTPPAAAFARRPRAQTIYQCPECEERLIGEQRCEVCNTFYRRLGPGAERPCCGELIAIAELIDASA